MGKWEWDNKYKWFGYYGEPHQIHVLMKEFRTIRDFSNVYDYRGKSQIRHAYTNLQDMLKDIPKPEQFKQEYLKKKIKSI